MTLHISYNHKCRECGASYIPYGKEVHCPRCGLYETERFESFVSQAAASALYNLRSGRYTPPVWGCFSLADNFLFLLFQLFDGFTAEREGQNFDEFTASFVKACQFGDAEYLRDYMEILACSVYKEIKKING